MLKVDIPLKYNTLLESQPDISNNYEVQAVFDSENGKVNISINDKYVGQLSCIKRFWWTLNTIKVQIHDKEYVFNRTSYIKHLLDLGIMTAPTQNYLLDISNVDPVALERFHDRLWYHLGSKLKYQLITDYHSALERNDFQEAINLVKLGVPLDKYYTYKCGFKTTIFLEEPTSAKLCKIHDDLDPVSNYSHYDTITCISHSPLTALLSSPMNDIQADKRAELIQLLKDWGTSSIKEQKEYTVFVYVSPGYKSTRTRAYSCRITKHRM
jgi:hypothetical protein